jgi:sulfite exporter TauE/SafE
MKITALAPLVATGVGVWAVLNAVFPFVAVMNERRDTVITGCLAGTPITPEHRTLIMNADHLIMTGSMVLLLFGIGTFVLFLPSQIAHLSDGEDPAKYITVSKEAKFAMQCAGIGFLIAALAWGWSGSFEHAAMKTALQKNTAPICKSETVDPSKTRPSLDAHLLQGD